MLSSNHGNMGLRIIVFMGIGTFLFLMLMAFGLKKTLQPRETERVPARAASSPFGEDRAWADLEHLAGLGPRPAGSPAMADQQQYVLRALRQAGLSTRRFAFEAATPRGTLAMATVVGVVQGDRPGTILLCAHYDTRPGPDLSGVNDGAANAAWLLEMARVFGGRREGRSIWLAFLDGEEAQDPALEEDSRLGSRQLAAALREGGELADLHAVISINMIGDCYLAIAKDRDAPDWLSEILWNTAERNGYREHFIAAPGTVRDSHEPFRAVGIPAIALADSSYGGSSLDHARNWHTPNDTLDRVCRESLRAVGDVIYHALTPLEGHLDSTGTHSDGR